MIVCLYCLKNIICREIPFIIKYYNHRSKCYFIDSSMILMADGKMRHGGLFDRLKGIVSIYAISKVHKKKFSIFFVDPFRLEDYLVPNQYDWRAKDNEIIYSYPHTRPVIAYSEFRNPWRLFKSYQGQTHFYFGNDILEYVNQKYGASFEWMALYHELFRPSDYLMKHVDEVKAEIGTKYFAIHLRFMNLLGDKVESRKDTKLSEEEKRKLITTCVIKIKELCSRMKIRAVVFSDSMVFLQEMKKKLPEVYIVSGNARHIGTAGKTTDDENLKLFTDMYLMVDAQKVYSIVGKGLYPSAFPEYSAKIGNKPFERVEL